MAYGEFKYLNRTAATDKVLREKEINIVKNPKYDGYERGFASVAFKFFDKKLSCGPVKNKIMFNKKLAEELHKPVFRKFEKRKVDSQFIENFCLTDLADIQLINKFNKRFRFFLYGIDIYSKHAWVIPLKEFIMLFEEF